MRQSIGPAETVDIFKHKALAERRAAAWKTWGSRLFNAPFEPGSSASRPLDGPTVDEMNCAAARVSPASLLQINLSEMGVDAWSQVLLWALADADPETACYAPMWASIPALLSLGFPPGSWTAMVKALQQSEVSYSRRPVQDELPVLTSWSARSGAQPTQGKPALLILRKSQGSAVGTWKASTKGAAFVLDIAEAARLGHIWPTALANLAVFVPIDRAAIEFGAGEGGAVLHKALERAAKKKGLSVPKSPLMFETEPPADGSLAKNLARNLDDLLARHLADTAA